MAPYRTHAKVPRHATTAATVTPGTSDSVIAWLMILIGGGRVAQAVRGHETWGAEATLCLFLLVFGVADRMRACRTDRRSR